MELGRKNPEVPNQLETAKSFENEAVKNLEQDKKRADSLEENKGIEKISERKDCEKNKNQDFNQAPEEKRAEKIDRTAESQQVFHSSFSDKIKDYFSGRESSYDVKRAEAHGLEKGCFDAVPREYREAVYQKFENAPDEIKKFINDNSEKISVQEILQCQDSYYQNRIISMEKGLAKEEYANVFSHEYGHFYDEAHFKYSSTLDFRNSVKKDLEQYDRATSKGREWFDKMLNSLFSLDAADDRMVSDNLSAYFVNDFEIMKRYDIEGAKYYQHEDSYWAEQGAREAEIYANSFSIYVSNFKDSILFMKEFFPETWRSVNESMEE